MGIVAWVATREAPRAAWRRASLALLGGALFLLLAVALVAVGDRALGVLMAGIAALWIWIAVVEINDTRSLWATRKLHLQIRPQVMPTLG